MAACMLWIFFQVLILKSVLKKHKKSFILIPKCKRLFIIQMGSTSALFPSGSTSTTPRAISSASTSFSTPPTWPKRTWSSWSSSWPSGCSARSRTPLPATTSHSRRSSRWGPKTRYQWWTTSGTRAPCLIRAVTHISSCSLLRLKPTST